jgi:transposase
MNIRHRVERSEPERLELEALVSGVKHPARKLERAQILPATDAKARDETIASAVRVCGSTVYRTKRRFVEGNLELALSEEPRRGAAPKLSGRETALLVATVCSGPPRGASVGRWICWHAGRCDSQAHTQEHDRLSRETVRRRLAEDLAQRHVVYRASRRPRFLRCR